MPCPLEPKEREWKKKKGARKIAQATHPVIKGSDSSQELGKHIEGRKASGSDRGREVQATAVQPRRNKPPRSPALRRTKNFVPPNPGARTT